MERWGEDQSEETSSGEPEAEEGCNKGGEGKGGEEEVEDVGAGRVGEREMIWGRPREGGEY